MRVLIVGATGTLLDAAGSLDAVVSCAASAPLAAFADQAPSAFAALIAPKLLGQVELTRQALGRFGDRGGSVTLTAGRFDEPLAGSAAGALVNAGLEAFVTAVTAELDPARRVNAVSPGWLTETLQALAC